MLTRYEQVGTKDFLAIVNDAVKDKFTKKIKQPFNQPSLPSININIKFNAWEKIKKQRSDMLGRIFMRDIQDYQKATIQINNKSIPVKIRLKGGRFDHINKPNRWSLRVKTRKGKTVFGMKVFSLQHPQTRGYQREAVFHELARKKGLLALNYLFVNVSINGEFQGIMAIEEVPSKLMLERERVKEGLIYQLDDINVRRMYHSVLDHHILKTPELESSLSLASPDKMYNGHYKRISRIFYNALNAPIKEITRKKEDLNYTRQRPIAVGLLKALREGKIAPSDVFDATQTGLFYAYLALWGDTHNASFRNSKFYFNPYTFKFEPIVYDSNAYGSRHNQLYPYRSTFRDHELNRILLSDPLILNSYIKFVEKFLGFSQQDNFIDILRSLEKPHLSHLRDEFWLLPALNISSMKESISFIQKQITSKKLFKVERELINDINDPNPLEIPSQFKIPKVLHVDFIDQNEFGQFLEIHNLFPIKSKITKLSIEVDGKKLDVKNHINASLPFEVNPFFYNSFYSQQKIKLTNLPSFKRIKISGETILDGQTKISHSFTAQKSYAPITQHPLKSHSLSQIINTYSFISYDKNNRQFNINKGDWKIPEYIIFPPNNSLVIAGGTNLKFMKTAGFLIKGDLQINGSKSDPVVFEGLSDLKESSWLGITVMNAHKRSSINYSTFKNTNFTKLKQWQLTGGVNFYKSDIDINHSHFKNTQAEDALNIVKSDFKLSHSSINNSISDGLDSDFSKGIIINSSFNNIGGDAVDFSGSDISLQNSSFADVYDKSISVGENSKVRANNLIINRSGTGIAVKDASQCEIASSSFKHIKHATLMSYTKKKSYDPSILNARDIIFTEKTLAVISQGQNKLIIDGKRVPSIKINIDKFYDEGYMKK